MIKLFEEYKRIKGETPKKGDYVKINFHSHNQPSFDDYINNSIGKIYDIDFKNYEIRVEYEKIPNNIKGFFYDNTSDFDISCVAEYGKTIEELELKLTANKYNL